MCSSGITAVELIPSFILVISAVGDGNNNTFRIFCSFNEFLWTTQKQEAPVVVVQTDLELTLGLLTWSLTNLCAIMFAAQELVINVISARVKDVS